MAFDNFPYTNFHELNADWMLQTLKILRANVEEALQSVESALEFLQQYNQRLTDLESGAVMFTKDQELTSAEQATARENIGALGLDAFNASAVRYDVLQNLTELQQSNARRNIRALGLEGFISSAVRYDTTQNLTETQRITARENIGAAPSEGVVMYNTTQQLPEADKERARQNIGAAPSEGVVMYNKVQQLPEASKARARQNIGAISAADVPSVTGTVQYDQVQTLTDSQKAQARANISAAATADIPDVTDVIRYSAQSLTARQKAQARANIGVSGSEDQPLLVTIYYNELRPGYDCDTAVTDIIEAFNNGRLIIIIFTPENSDTKYQCAATIDPLASPNTVIAHAYNPEGPGALDPFNWYRIYMTAGNDSDTLTVTYLSGRLVPSPQAGDAGMVLTVSNTGRPTWVPKDPTVVTDLGSSSITLAAQDNTEYNYGELSALTITSIPTTGEFSIVFVSGSTPTALTIPPTMVMPDDFSSVKANTRYEINVKNGYALVGSWRVSA